MSRPARRCSLAHGCGLAPLLPGEQVPGKDHPGGKPDIPCDRPQRYRPQLADNHCPSSFPRQSPGRPALRSLRVPTNPANAPRRREASGPRGVSHAQGTRGHLPRGVGTSTAGTPAVASLSSDREGGAPRPRKHQAGGGSASEAG